jgi:serine/threonine-protein kinase
MNVSTPERADATDNDSIVDSTHSQEFLQQRVALFALAGALLGLTFLVFRSVSALAAGRLSLTHPSMTAHVLGMVSYVVVWLVARRGRYGVRAIRALENTAIVLTAGFYTAMAVMLPIGLRPDYVLILCLTLIVMTRSILVPSTATRTGVIVAIVGVILVAGVYAAYKGADLSAYPPLVRRELLPVTGAVRSAVWWLLTSGLAVTTSHVIYGLQREINKARRLGQYALEEKLGEGGMGVVYRASHAMLRRPTAVKLLAPEKAGEETIARFEREVRLTARLTHPNTITIYDYGRTPEGIFYYAMELLDGASIEAVVDISGAQPAGRVIHIASQIASALVEAHLVGLIHRDIKPANIILCERGGMSDVVKVVDFGLVRELETDAAALSRAGVVSGTPLYLAPEAIHSPEHIDARVDLYALGAVMYYLLAGDHVFRGRTTMEVCAHHLHTEPTPIGERAKVPVPRDLAGIVMDCLKKAPSERPQGAAELLRRLQQCGDARAWTMENARAWWADNGAKMRTHQASRTSSAGSTIAVDLRRR